MLTQLKTRPRLGLHGVDLQYFPNYMRTEPFLHSLDVVLLSFIIRGHGWHMMEDDVFEEHGGSIGITHYGQRHSIVTDCGGMDIMNIYVDPEHYPLPVLPGRLQAVLPELIPLHPGFQHRLNRVVRLEFRDPTRLLQLVFSMYDELERPREGSIEAVAHYWQLVLTELCRHALDGGLIPSVPHATVALPGVEAVRRRLDTTWSRHHTLEELAELAGLSRTYLCRAFKAYTGKSVVSYLNDRRVQMAMQALRAGAGRITTVALEAGFRDLAFFNRVFKTRVGMTPGRYRDMQRSLHLQLAQPDH